MRILAVSGNDVASSQAFQLTLEWWMGPAVMGFIVITGLAAAGIVWLIGLMMRKTKRSEP